MAAKKKTHFTGPEMSALSGPLTADQTRLAQASFFIAARVANAAWALLEQLRTHPDVTAMIDARPDLQGDAEKLVAALNEYSPGNWPPPPTFKGYAAKKLEELYAEMEALPNKEAMLEKIYEFITQEYE